MAKRAKASRGGGRKGVASVLGGGGGKSVVSAISSRARGFVGGGTSRSRGSSVARAKRQLRLAIIKSATMKVKMGGRGKMVNLALAV